MYNKDYKYIYYEDMRGKVLGYIDETRPSSEDEIFVTIIAEKNHVSINTYSPWDITNRNCTIMVDLKRLQYWRFYDDYEEFFAAFFEAIL
ncbi:MAG: hypothetical protein PHS54_00595 [Clostridia bacterium]|nr:hypothetical protein [Clostridia bacterium]